MMISLLLSLVFSPIASSSSAASSVCPGYTVATLQSGRTVTICGGKVVQVSDQLGNVRTIGE